MDKKLIPALITTDSTKRGVFFGYISPDDVDKDPIQAEQVQMCVRWSEDVRGVLGLAADGPSKKSRVTAPTKKALIKGITLVVETSDKAAKAWKSQPWAT